MQVNITPSPRLAASLREGNHNQFTAVHDLIDNCIDAQATNITIDAGVDKKDWQIRIADNGVGMDQERLLGCLTLGATTNEGKQGVMGRFGMGMKASVGTLGDRCVILTKTDTSPTVLRATFDFGQIERENAWVADIDNASDEEVVLFNQLVDDGSGTVLIIRGIERNWTNYGSVIQYAKILAGHVGATFRNFIANCGITVNGVEIESVDVLERHLKSTRIMFNEDIEVAPNRFVHATVVFLDPSEKSANVKDKGNFNYLPNHKTQGIYLVRNNRQIGAGLGAQSSDVDGDFGWLWVRKDGTKNYCRIELAYWDMDDLFHVDNAKVVIKHIEENVKSKLTEKLAMLVQQASREQVAEAAKSKVNDPNDQKAHDDVSRVVANKKNTLDLPSAKKQKRKTGKNKGTVEPKHTKIRRYGIDPDKKNSVEKFRVETHDWGNGGQFFDFGIGENNVIVLKYNVQHPYYITYVAGKSADQIHAIDWLFFAFSAKLLKQAGIANGDSDAYATFLDDLRESVSTNLRLVLA